jgi:hypothetical protein
MATYADKLRERRAQIPARAEKARAIYRDLKPLLSRYHGGMPVGFLAAIAQWESGGKMSSRGDPALGEVGIFQITSSFPREIGWPPDSRYEKEYNVFLGCLEYQIEAVQMFLASGIALGSEDNWKLARLAFAVGSPGTRRLLRASGATTYRQLLGYLDRTGGVALGKQSAGLVWFRAHSVNILWEIGKQVRAPFPSAPVQIPAPPGTSYQLPGDLNRYLIPRWTQILIAATVFGGALLIGSKYGKTSDPSSYRPSGERSPG